MILSKKRRGKKKREKKKGKGGEKTKEATLHATTWGMNDKLTKFANIFSLPPLFPVEKFSRLDILFIKPPSPMLFFEASSMRRDLPLFPVQRNFVSCFHSVAREIVSNSVKNCCPAGL